MPFKIHTRYAVLYFSISLGSCFGIEPDDISRLKNSGIGNSVIEAVEKEKILETCALSTQDIIQLKKSGFSDTEITAFIYHRSFLKNAKPRIYKNFDSAPKTTEIDIQELEHLKEVGFSDDVIKAIILQQTMADEGSDFFKTMKMFENMGVILDMRTKENERNKPSQPR